MIACNTLYRKPYPSVNLKFFSDRAAFCPPHGHLINRTCKFVNDVLQIREGL